MAPRNPQEEHILLMAPPRTGKTGWPAGVTLPTTTKADVFGPEEGLDPEPEAG